MSHQAERSMAVWSQTLQPYIAGWVTATTSVWPSNEPFEEWRADFDAYLQTYKRTTRLRLVQTSHPEQMQPPSVTDMYPLEAIAGTRHYAVRNKHLIFLYVCLINQT